MKPSYLQQGVVITAFLHFCHLLDNFIHVHGIQCANKQWLDAVTLLDTLPRRLPETAWDDFLLDRVGRFWKDGRTICSLRLSNEEGRPHEEDTR
ncbi:hypothetical protein Naga_100153g4 [Nannochloropsis gaditana]|uniref:Uncharacterized protein n=1 Tax=Nannochloropsis gaditana TaxID=72520 RepID=W7T591_9STRA|nr:hypothetical protein Naga_100153g4 [Nannochloropsis gaditana]